MHSIKEKSFIFVLVGGCDELVGSESLRALTFRLPFVVLDVTL